jgi:hypothetical protein
MREATEKEKNFKIDPAYLKWQFRASLIKHHGVDGEKVNLFKIGREVRP